MLIPLEWIGYFKYRSRNFNWIIQIDFLVNSHYLFRLYKKPVKKEKEIKQKWFLKRQKNPKKTNVLKIK